MHAAATPVQFLWLIPALPALGVLLNIFVGPRAGRGAVNFVSPAVVGVSFALACYTFMRLLDLPHGAALVQDVYPWITAGTLDVHVAFHIDALSGVMISIVTGVGFLIHVYSTGYMHEDAGYARYFAYLNLFMFSMLLLVMADSLPLMFVGWEGVGVCSYLLIGFWYDKEANASAGKKAFVVNRVGDAGFILGIFLIFWTLGPGTHSLRFTEIAAYASKIPPHTVTVITLLLFVGATGKSAQLPLYVWLPDAMAGPTPVSALIHAATMVTAGVYMIARLNFLYILSPTSMTVVATIGALTALFAATIGLMQNDIKKVLAYSTISQLGYMFLGVGVGAFSSGIFHLMTHAFFKGLLFLGSGSVIHGMSGEQDMQKMGGLRSYMPITCWTFFAGTLAIAGFPPFAGFFSKDAILGAAYGSEHGSVWLWVLGLLAAGLTSFYMFRLLFLTFFGECRIDEHAKHHLHESPASMTMPLIVLAILSLIGGWIGLPEHWLWGDRFGEFLAPIFSGAYASEHLSAGTESVLMGASVVAAAIGFGVAYLFYLVQPGLPMLLAWKAKGAYNLIFNKYYVDELYDLLFVRSTLALSTFFWRAVDSEVIDGLVNGTARVVNANGGLWRRLQTGNVQHYAISMLLGAVVILGYYALR
ncbi:MAG TPA: NADH-quinone oxidoreductase subunit L [Candidatus Margulisiibacteriota bacterium]|nr:NADH-quinone oxidoreductase subunit L [Candidatus Margulisiibacteriota bacterium]